MANFRHAQTASYGFLPGPKGSGLENTFIAQAYDAADPGNRYYGPPHENNNRQQWSEVDSPYQAGYDAPFRGREGYSAGGKQRYTQQYMGGLHPRAKQTIGRRLALAAAHVAYGRSDVPFTGPVLRTCTVLNHGNMCLPSEFDAKDCPPKSSNDHGIEQREIMLDFDETLLGEDAVHVWPTSPDTEGLAMMAMYNCLNGTCITECNKASSTNGNATCAEGCTLNTPACRMGLPVIPVGPAGNGGNPTQYNANHLHWRTGRTISPLEVQFNNSIWMPASISFNAGHTQNDPIHRNCHPDPRKPSAKPCKNWTKANGWKTVVGVAPVAVPIGCGGGLNQQTGEYQDCPPTDQLNGKWCQNCTARFQITGVRYAWGENPCCGGNMGSNLVPCPVNSCPISTWNSSLPAVPFSASIVYNNDTGLGVGHCKCTAPQVCH